MHDGLTTKAALKTMVHDEDGFENSVKHKHYYKLSFLARFRISIESNNCERGGRKLASME